MVKHPTLPISILNVSMQLAKNVKQQASVTIGALSDLVKHLCKCQQNQVEVSSLKIRDKLNSDLWSALERCIFQLSNKVCAFTSNFKFKIKGFCESIV